MRSYNPTFGLWNDGEDTVWNRQKKGAEVLDKSVEEAARASMVHECITYHADKELFKKGIIRKVDE